MSTIRTLYTDLAALSMNFTAENSTTITVSGKDISAFKRNNVVQRADLPIRYILPLADYGTNPSGFTEPANMGAAGVGGTMIWNVVDIFLYKQAGQDRSFSNILPNLVRYAGNYMETILENTQLTTDMFLQSATPRIDVINFPIGTDNDYYGVEVSLEFLENINKGG